MSKFREVGAQGRAGGRAGGQSVGRSGGRAVLFVGLVRRAVHPFGRLLFWSVSFINLVDWLVGRSVGRQVGR